MSDKIVDLLGDLITDLYVGAKLFKPRAIAASRSWTRPPG
jgi:hypothetical protein